MTNLQSIKHQLRQIYHRQPGRLIVLFGDEPYYDEPTPPVIYPNDVIVRCRSRDRLL